MNSVEVEVEVEVVAVSGQYEDDLVGVLQCNRPWVPNDDVEVVYWAHIPQHIADACGIEEGDTLSAHSLREVWFTHGW
jgi:hypothetical protein